MGSKSNENSFPNIVLDLLQEVNTVQALTLFLDNRNDREIYNNSWDLIPIITRYLTEDCEKNQTDVFKCCQKLIAVIAERAKAEEILLQFIEEIESATDDTKFLALLKPLETVLLRVPDKRVTSLGWCFNAMKNYLVKIEAPYGARLEGEERRFDCDDDNIVRINNLCEELSSFCQIFIEKSIGLNEDAATIEKKHILTKFLVEMLGKPLGFLDMTAHKDVVKSKSRIVAEKLLEIIFCVVRDPFIYLELDVGDYDSDLNKPSDLSLGIFYYLLFSEEMCINRIPKVYNSIYVLHNSLNLINTLLTQDCQFIVEKGVTLSEVLFKKIDILHLPYLLLDSEHHAKFCKSLSNVIIHNDSESVRKKALQILHKYLWSFEHQGRYLIITNLMRTLPHSGLKGNVITQYKEMMSVELRSCDTLETISRYYKAQKLFNLLDLFTVFDNNKEETDLVHESDQIISTLNFFRYLLILDKENHTKIDLYIKSLEEKYLKRLKTGIELSKKHYKSKMNELIDESERKDVECKVSVTTISGSNLTELPRRKKIEIINLSLTILDVIDSLLNRVQECINIRKANCTVCQ